MTDPWAGAYGTSPTHKSTAQDHGAAAAGGLVRTGAWWAARFLRSPAPEQAWLDKQLHSHDPEYEEWLRARSVTTVAQWRQLRRTSLRWLRPPRISIVTPVCDPSEDQLRECLESVQAQAYPNWELRLVDDASSSPAVLRLLTRAARSEPRIRVQWNSARSGIVASLNRGVTMARGDFVAFLDHDDVLTPDALFHVAAAIRADPDVDVLYSDRDLLQPDGHHHRPLFKPAWSPETLLSGNYLFHFLTYRRSAVAAVGGFRGEYEGSQDYDLALRVTERTHRVRHIPRILYHWREHERSIAGNPQAKQYVFDAGQRALRDALHRRGFTAHVTPVTGCTGHYRAHLSGPPPDEVEVVRLSADEAASAYRRTIDVAVAASDRKYVVVLGPGVVETAGHQSLATLVSWLRVQGVAVTTGRVDTSGGRIAHAGLAVSGDGRPDALYRDEPTTETGYMAFAAAMRNVSIPHPFCFAVRRETWLQFAAGRSGTPFTGPHAALDVARQAAAHGMRTVYVPYDGFLVGQQLRDTWRDDAEGQLFRTTHHRDAATPDPFHPWEWSGSHPQVVLDLRATVTPVSR